jgi:hypothetical protein
VSLSALLQDAASAAQRIPKVEVEIDDLGA